MAVLNETWDQYPGRMHLRKARNDRTPAFRVGTDLLSRIFLSLICTILLSHSETNADTIRSSENVVKATFLYNFAKFVEWPPEAFRSADAPIILAILGEDTFGDATRSVRNRTAGGRQLEIRYFRDVADIQECHILFISVSEKKHFSRILEAVRGSPFLTVSDTDTFMRHGGMIRLFREDNKIRFEISPEAAEAARLKISSRLLKLARIFRPGKTGVPNPK